MTKKYRGWTDEEVQKLREWNGKHRVAWQAEQLGRSVMSVNRKRERLDVKNPRKWTDEMTERMNEGLSKLEEELGVTRGSLLSRATRDWYGYK